MAPRGISLAVALILALSVPGARAYSTGPPADRVGLCNARPSCADILCHGDYPVNTGTAVSTLEAVPGPTPQSYKAGELRRFLLSVTDPDPTRVRFGFQIAAVLDCPFAAQAGSLALAEPARTRLETGAGISFVEHTCFVLNDPPNCGYLPTAPGANAWTFDWTAPDPADAPVTFFWAINSADGSSSETGDYISLGETTLVPSCPRRVTSLAARRTDCDPGAPGEARTGLSWSPVPWASGYTIYRTTDRAALPDPGGLGASVLADPCDDPPPGAVHYYSVVGLCDDATEGPP